MLMNTLKMIKVITIINVSIMAKMLESPHPFKGIQPEKPSLNPQNDELYGGSGAQFLVCSDKSYMNWPQLSPVSIRTNVLIVIPNDLKFATSL
mmetsp:Transcript_27872/g.38403  ORF Transcript_27872/g.38403 Transcript_27872/m.38403 type:complete len:93 (+) Transcript_27872:2459-2737(+)